MGIIFIFMLAVYLVFIKAHSLTSDTLFLRRNRLLSDPFRPRCRLSSWGRPGSLFVLCANFVIDPDLAVSPNVNSPLHRAIMDQGGGERAKEMKTILV